jgi:3-hydroxyacyl-[acyl-carrier-protein] dehydratase
MRFQLVDRILEVEPGKRIRIAKNLTLAEEYLADHFPTFPVMPGVLMLQTLVEAGAWLLRITDDFRHSVIVLREAKNVKYGTFEAGGQTTVAAKFTVARYNLADRNPALKPADERIVAHLRAVHAVLRGDLNAACGMAG